jgi:hypothetical protein
MPLILLEQVVRLRGLERYPERRSLLLGVQLGQELAPLMKEVLVRWRESCLAGQPVLTWKNHPALY